MSGGCWGEQRLLPSSSPWLAWDTDVLLPPADQDTRVNKKPQVKPTFNFLFSLQMSPVFTPFSAKPWNGWPGDGCAHPGAASLLGQAEHPHHSPAVVLYLLRGSWLPCVQLQHVTLNPACLCCSLVCLLQQRGQTLVSSDQGWASKCKKRMKKQKSPWLWQLRVAQSLVHDV